MFLQQSASGLNFGSVQLPSGNSSTVQQLTPINMQGQVVQSNQTQSGMNTGHISTPHMIQQQPLQSTATQVKFYHSFCWMEYLLKMTAETQQLP